LYYWSAQLAGPKHAALAGWTTGWFTWIGLLGVSAGSAFSFGQIFTALLYANPTSPLNLSRDASTSHAAEIETMRYKLICFAATAFVLFTVAILNSFSTKWLHKASQMWVPFNIAVMVVLSIACPIGASLKGMDMLSLGELYGLWNNSTGLPDSWAGAVGLLLPCFLYVGYDAPAHMSEESQHAMRSGPFAIITSILFGFLGWFTLWGALCTIPPSTYETLIKDPKTTSAGVDVWVNTVGPTGAVVMGVLLLVFQWTTMVSAVAAQ
ncbi:hypothetical protein HK104_006730, partial [Borealophlyctis nickersoniae]